LFARLPEEEVRRHGRPEHGNQRGEARAPADQVGHDGVPGHLAPIDVHQRQHDHYVSNDSTSHRKTMLYRRYGSASSGTRMLAVINRTNSSVGTGTTRLAAAAMDRMSAPMLNVFAMTVSATAT